MGLQLLPNQAVVLDELYRNCVECHTGCYCQKYNALDYLYWQAKQEPCPLELICDGIFERFSNTPIVSAVNMVTNGTFTGSATGWTLTWGWAYNVNNIKNTPNTHQSRASQGILFVPGKTYQINYTVSGRTAGSVQCAFVTNQGIYYGNTVSINGANQEDLLGISGASPYFVLIASTAFDGVIDDVRIYEYDDDYTNDCWTVDSSADIIIPNVGGEICHIDGGITNIVQAGVLEAGKTYQIIVETTDVTAGGLQILLGTVLSDPVENSGVFTLYATSDGTDLTIWMSADFVGCIKSIQLRLMPNGVRAFLVNNDTGDCVEDITSDITYYKDWVTIAKEWWRFGVLEGCYTLRISDTCCDYGVICNGDFAIATGDSGVCWTEDVAGGATSVIGGGVWTVVLNGNAELGIITQIVEPCFCRRYKIRFDYDGDDVWASRVYFRELCANGVSSTLVESYQLFAAGAGTYETEVSLPDYQGVCPIYFNMRVETAGGGFPTTVIIDNLEIILLDVDCQLDCMYESNCLCWESSTETPFECRNIIQAYSDNPAFGFEFLNSGFRLQQRLPFSLFNASYSEEEENYNYSDDTRELYFAHVEKFEQIFFERVPEYVHDCISIQRRNKHFFIGDVNDALTEYYVKPSDYQPEWVKNSLIREAPSRFDIRKKSGNGFMFNCSE